MKFVYFVHSLSSCWNHGNAHFIRGIARALTAMGHEMVLYEPERGWSLVNLLAEHGAAGLADFHSAFPDLASRLYGPSSKLPQMVADADVVLVHEWNDPKLVAALGRMRARGRRFQLFFHDTHHRMVSDPDAMSRFDFEGYDGILAFGETLAEAYRAHGWGAAAHVWHEAADLSHFSPPEVEGERSGLIWIGNWGDGERSRELETYLLAPARAARIPLHVHGVRYPPAVVARIRDGGGHYGGWLANAAVPACFARHAMTVHVPRRHYAQSLPGIPTIRMFEALACGLPLVSAPWSDCEGLFRESRDYLRAANGNEMRRHLRALKEDSGLRTELAANGRDTIVARHSCAHRAEELVGIVAAEEPAARNAA